MPQGKGTYGSKIGRPKKPITKKSNNKKTNNKKSNNKPNAKNSKCKLC